jgi:hypothetical protein
MAKVVGGVPPFVGTRDNLTIYLMNGEYIVRTKSSLTGKRVKRDPAFARTMKYAGWLKQGARLASLVYKKIPADERVYKQYRELTGRVMSLLKEGFDADDVITMLEAVYLSQPMEDAVGRGTEGYREHTCELSSERGSEYGGKYFSKYTGKYSSEYCIGYTGKYDSRSVYNCNGKRYFECSCIRVKSKGKCTNANEYKYAHEYIPPYNCFGDRPQRAVQVGITGLSYLKYADVTHQGFNRNTKAHPPPKSLIERELQRTTASDPILQP